MNSQHITIMDVFQSGLSCFLLTCTIAPLHTLGPQCHVPVHVPIVKPQSMRVGHTLGGVHLGTALLNWVCEHPCCCQGGFVDVITASYT